MTECIANGESRRAEIDVDRQALRGLERELGSVSVSTGTGPSGRWRSGFDNG